MERALGADAAVTADGMLDLMKGEHQMNPQHLQNLLRRLDNVRTQLQTLTAVAAEVYAIEAEIHAVTQQIGITQQFSPYGQQYGAQGFGGQDIGTQGGGRRRRRGRNRGQGIGAQGFGQQSQWGGQQQAFPFTAPNMGAQGGGGINTDVIRQISNQVTQQVLNSLRQQGSPFGQAQVGQS